MKAVTSSVFVLILATVAPAPPLLAGRAPRTGDPASDRERPLTPAGRGDQSEPGVPGVTAPQQPALRDAQPRITPFCEPVPEKFQIVGLGSVATDQGTVGYVIDEPGLYVLSADVVASAVDIGILIRSHNVILDLNRHKLSDSTGMSTLVRIEPVMNVTIENGSLEGGKTGVDAQESGGEGSSFLTLRGLRISGAGAEYRPVALKERHHFRITDSSTRGGQISILDSFAGLISGNRLQSSLDSDFSDLDGLRLVNNHVEGWARIGGYGSLIRGNSFKGFSSLSALWARGPGFVTDNEIDANGRPYAVVVEGPSIARRNLVKGGSYYTFVIGDDRSIVAENVISSDNIAFELSRSNNLIEENRIGGPGPWCGLYFGSESSGNVYRRNRFSNTGLLACGRENIDAGDNEIVAGGSIGGLGRRVQPDDGEHVTRFGRPARACDQGEVIRISEESPVTVGDEAVGLLIDAPGYYLVTQDLDLSRFDVGVLITGHDVTLDLGGHSIRASQLNGARISGGKNVILRNGEILGGSLGLQIEGEDGPGMSRVRVQGLRLAWAATGYATYSPLRINDLDYLELLDSHLSAGLSMGIVSGNTTGIIAGNWFSVSFGSAVELERFHDGLIRDNRILGRLRLGGGNSATLNTFGYLHLHGSDNSLVSNVVTDDVEVLPGADKTLFKGNATLSAKVVLHSSENRVLGNTLGTLTVGGNGTRIENNLISTSGDCALILMTDGGHVYSDNVVRGQESLCGRLNVDDGGNYFSPSRCNNGSRGINEVCDKQDTAGLNCTDFGFQGGTLACNQTCDGFDTSSCTDL